MSAEIIEGFRKPNGSTFYVSPVAGELTKTLKAAAGFLHYGRFVNTTAAKIYVFLFDNTAASGTLLCPPIPVAPNDQFEFKMVAALQYATGCTVSASTTPTSYTAAGANALQIHALWS